MATLTEFLLARIAEDEAAARAATPGPWHALDGGVTDRSYGAEDDSQWPVASTDSVRDRPDRVHIANWNPDRALAECAAKRQIIALQGAEVCTAPGDPTHYAEQPSDRGDFDTPMGGCVVCGVSAGDPISPILRLLALPYASRSDYRREWRPARPTRDLPVGLGQNDERGVAPILYHANQFVGNTFGGGGFAIVDWDDWTR